MFIFLSQKSLVEFYKNTPDMVYFGETWHQDDTFLSKLKVRCEILECNVLCQLLRWDKNFNFKRGKGIFQWNFKNSRDGFHWNYQYEGPLSLPPNSFSAQWGSSDTTLHSLPSFCPTNFFFLKSGGCELVKHLQESNVGTLKNTLEVKYRLNCMRGNDILNDVEVHKTFNSRWVI